MKKLYILMAALLALAFFAIPAMADDVTVTVTVDSVFCLDYDGDAVTFTLDYDDLTAGYYQTGDEADIDWYTNRGSDDIEVTRTAGSFPTDWTLKVDTDGDASNGTTITTGAADFVSVGPGTGSFDTITYYLSGFDWADAPGDYATTVTYTLTD